MATHYSCDVCGKPALTKNGMEESRCAFAPELAFQGLSVKILIFKPDSPNVQSHNSRRDEVFGDLCRDCLVSALLKGTQEKTP